MKLLGERVEVAVVLLGVVDAPKDVKGIYVRRKRPSAEVEATFQTHVKLRIGWKSSRVTVFLSHQPLQINSRSELNRLVNRKRQPARYPYLAGKNKAFNSRDAYEC